jgi:hypothetical protein
MSAQRSVVVTDVASPQRFVACLTAVAKTVDRDVEVVGISPHFPVLPKALDRRVRKVRPAKGTSMSDVVASEALRPVTVVVLTSDTRVSGEWLQHLERSIEATPHCVGILGGSHGRVLVFGTKVLSTQAQEIELPDCPGLTWPRTGRTPQQQRDAVTRSGAGRSGTLEPATITAALIVKDEQDVLAECLEAVRAEVDEVVVYDTGSTDASVTVAESAGARVIQGYWDDDFAAARNRLLEHCTTTWVLSIDADEVLQSEPGALRRRLENETADLLLVPIFSTAWSAADDGEEHRPVRVFRRRRGQWSGSLHETVVSRSSHPLVLAHAPAPMRLLHSGYQADRMAAKDKRSRNLSIARAQVDALPGSAPDEIAARAWANYGRALVSAGRREEGMAAFDEMLSLQGNPSEMVQAGRVALTTALALPRLHTFDRWLELLQRYGEAEGALALWRARLLLHHGDLEGALAELDVAESLGGTDPWGQPFDPSDTLATRAGVYSRRGDHPEAFALLIDLLRRRQEAVPLAHLLQAAVNAGRPLGELIDHGGPKFLERSLRDAVALPAGAADQWLDAVWSADPQPGVLVAGAVAARRLPMDGVLKWSLRVREAGLVDLCPLRAIGYDAARPAAERCLALAVLGDVLAEAEALAAFDTVAADLPDDETGPLLEALATYAPGLSVGAADPVGVA